MTTTSLQRTTYINTLNVHRFHTDHQSIFGCITFSHFFSRSSFVGLDTNNLNIGITKGDVVLTNLRLKKSALDGLELPVVIKEGSLELSA
jgi:hypothetical protein